MSEFVTRADKYFRRTDTRLARGLEKISKKGPDYRQSLQVAERIVAVPLAIAATPVIGALALAVKLEDGGPCLYSEKRIGQNGVVFDLFKIRSLSVGAQHDYENNILNVHNNGKKDDPRSTNIGRWMRKHKVDELPQLWQVVGGTLSFFGPRPENQSLIEVMKSERPEEYEIYSKKRDSAKPGLFNPSTSFGGNRYHTVPLYLEQRTLGTNLFMVFRTVVNNRLEREKAHRQEKQKAA